MTEALTAEESKALQGSQDIHGQPLPDHIELAANDRHVRKKIPFIQQSLKVFADKCRIIMSQHLLLTCDIQVKDVDVCGLKSLQASTRHWSASASMHWGHLGMAGFLGVNSVLSNVLIELAYGSPMTQAIAACTLVRPRLTELERQTLAPMLQKFADLLIASMPDLASSSNNRCSMLDYSWQIDFPSSDNVALLANLEFMIGSESASISVLLLSHVLEHVSEAPFNTEENTQWLAEHLKAMHVEVWSVLGTTQLSLRDLAHINIHDLVWLDQSQSAPIAVLVEGEVKFYGQPIARQGGLGVQIKTRLA